MPLASAWMIAAAAVIGLLGAVHLLYTFHGAKLHPRDPRLLRRMRQTAVVISPEASMWGAWVGFNASHSLGALLFAAVYGYLALRAPDLLFGSPFLLGLALTMLACLLWLAWRYWFRVPFYGIAVATLCCATAIGLGAAGV